MAAAGAFLESAGIVEKRYGTARADTERQLEAGLDLILVIDVQGADQLRRLGVPLTGIFLLPPSAEILERRLVNRARDSQRSIAGRLAKARDEMRAFADYDYVIVNGDVDVCADEVRAVILAERARLAERRACAEAIAREFDPAASGGVPGEEV